MVEEKLSTPQRFQQEVKLIIVVVLASYLALALLSFDPTDPSWLQTATHTIVKNRAGKVGAWIAESLFFLFGIAAYAVPLFILLFTGRTLHLHRVRLLLVPILRLHLIGYLLLMVAICGFLALYNKQTLHFPVGGVLGGLLVYWMVPWFNRLGTALLLTALWSIGFTLSTGCSWYRVGVAVVRSIRCQLYRVFTKMCGFFMALQRMVVHRAGTLQSSQPSPTVAIEKRQRAEPHFISTKETPMEPDQELHCFSCEADGNGEVVEMEGSFASPSVHHFLQQQKESGGVEEVVASVIPLDTCKAALNQAQERAMRLSSRCSPSPTESICEGSLLSARDATVLPSLDLLTSPTALEQPKARQQANLEQTAESVEAHLADYRVQAKVVAISPGPVITRYELNLAPGVKAARISALSRDLARALSVVAVRVVEVIPGKPYVGLELPNKQRQTVYLREVFNCAQFKNSQSPLTLVLGQDIAGQPIVVDLATMPHLLVAGTTGSGKSVGINAMILSMLYKVTPDEVRFIMIDPKMLELAAYAGIPHLLTEVVTDMKDAANALLWCVNEMERRYKLMSLLGVRNITSYNEYIRQAAAHAQPVPDPLWRCNDGVEEEPPLLTALPYIVVLIDELADLMMAVGKKVEELIARLAQKARAAGIHLVLATQRPSVDVITGLIKANIPTRIAFTVSSKIDSRTILDQTGAESLLGMGDMLYLPSSATLPIRVHGAFVRDQEVHAVVQDWKSKSSPRYALDVLADSEESGRKEQRLGSLEAHDPLFDEVVAFVAASRRSSISSVQRRFKIGYNRAARIIEQMEVEGIVSQPGYNGSREVLLPPSNPM